MTSSATNTVAASSGAETLRQAWQALSQQNPQLRIRDAATQLGVSEAELVASDCGRDTFRLRSEWGEILPALPALGRVMCLTRNTSVVHERYGRFEHVEVNGLMGLVLGPDIDLRLFLREWASAFAATQHLHSGTRNSLQFFDHSGTAVLKIYLTEDSDRSAYAALVARFRADDQSPALPVKAAPTAEPDRPDAEIDVPGLRRAWQSMQDTHEFFGLLRRFKVGRTQALRLIGNDLARSVTDDSLRRVLGEAAAREVEIMVFVGSRGCIQIHTGPVRKTQPMGPWFNVLDADFNLHVREDHIASSWIVRKPTSDGVVTSLELFDAAGETLALIFGKRKPGLPEAENWRGLIGDLFPKGL